MFLDDLEVIEPRDDVWLTRVREDAIVWLAKEQEFAQIEWRWHRPDVLREIGRIGLRRLWRSGEDWGSAGQQTWWMYRDGTGFDRRPLLLPVTGYVTWPAPAPSSYNSVQAVSNQAFWDAMLAMPYVVAYRILYP